jgi:hypothetical protein
MRFGSLPWVGWFGSQRKGQDAHRRGLAEARGFVERYRPRGSRYFGLESIPVEFRGAVLSHLENLASHIANTEEKDLGDSQWMRELGESLGFLRVVCSGKFSEESQRNFRTHGFDASVERLADLIERPDGPHPSLRGMNLEDAIASVEISLRWFAERPAPQSKKYSAEQARTILALGRKALEASQVPSRPSESARSMPQRLCANCGKANDDDAGFCKSCGQAFGATCSGCGLTQDADAAFCKRCGSRLKTPAE